jgi:hypothetical protein
MNADGGEALPPPHLRFPGLTVQTICEINKPSVRSVSEEIKRDLPRPPVGNIGCQPTPGLIASPMHFPSRPIRLLLSLSFCMVCNNSFAEPYTPAVGSPERVAIANAVRASVAQLGGQFEEDARRGAKFVIAVLKIE